MTRRHLQFRVLKKQQPETSTEAAALPPVLRSIPRIPESQSVRERLLTLSEHDDAAGNSMQMLLNRKPLDMPVTENRCSHSTEIWSFCSIWPEMLIHHLHLVRSRYWSAGRRCVCLQCRQIARLHGTCRASRRQRVGMERYGARRSGDGSRASLSSLRATQAVTSGTAIFWNTKIRDECDPTMSFLQPGRAPSAHPRPTKTSVTARVTGISIAAMKRSYIASKVAVWRRQHREGT